MTKLTDIQLILLTTASQREDGSLLPSPDDIRVSARRIRTSAAGLLKRGFAEEVEVTEEAQCWRSQEDRLVGLRITEAGCRAIGLETAVEGTSPHPVQKKSGSSSDTAQTPTPIARAGTKQSLVIELLKRDMGASINELVEATGWLPHTTRAALTGLRKRGCTIFSEKEAGVSRYRLTQEAQA